MSRHRLLPQPSRIYTKFPDAIDKGSTMMEQPSMKSQSSTNTEPSFPFYVRIMHNICGVSSSNSDSSHSAHQKTAQWKMIYNEDRFFHSSLEVSAKVSDADVAAYIAKEEDVAGSKPGSKDSSLSSVNQFSSGMNDLEEKKGTEPAEKDDDTDIYQKIDRTVDDEAVNTSQSGDYSYFKPKEEGKKAGRRIAFFDGKLKRVSKIDTCEETFHCVFHYYLTWLMSKEEVKAMKAAERNEKLDEAWKPKSHPQFECMNKVEGEMKQVGKFKIKEGRQFSCLPSQTPELDFQNGWGETWFDISGNHLGFDPTNAYWCRVQYECCFTCAEEMELEMFPFDCQDLGIYMRLKQKANQWDVLPLPRHGEIFNINARFSMVSEWNIPGVLLEFEQGDPKVAKNGIGYNSAIIRIKAGRKWQTHITDLFTICFMFFLGMATFGIPREDVGDRLSYSITLLLTQVATMQLLNESIPNIPYRTFLDMYTQISLYFLQLITAWVSAAGYGGRAWVSRKTDNRALYFFYMLAIVMHVIFYIWFCYGNKNEKSKMLMDSEGLDKYFEAMAHFSSSSSMPTAGVYWDSRSIHLKQDSNINPETTCIQKNRWTGLSYPWKDKNTIRKERADLKNYI